MKYFMLLLVALFMFGCGDAASTDITSIDQIDKIDQIKPNVPIQHLGQLEVIKTEESQILEKDRYDGPLTVVDRDTEDIDRATIKWEVSVNCNSQPGNPTLMFYDNNSEETFGPYEMSNMKKNINVQCQKGHEICWGAWLGKGNYSDCSDADETGFCVHVKWNPEYYSWGCGKDCKSSVPYWYCANCYDSSFSRGIHLNCGG